MKQNVIITISRQYGSSGHEIGRLVASQLNIPFYDKELLIMAAKNSGINLDFFENAEQDSTSSLLYNLSTGAQFDLSLTDKVYIAQRNVILEIAKSGSCIIVGRCADYILKDDCSLLKVFVYSDIEHREKHAISQYGYTEKNVHDSVIKNDKKRASYYNFYTGQKFGKTENYNLCIDNGYTGIEGAAKLITAAYLIKHHELTK